MLDVYYRVSEQSLKELSKPSPLVAGTRGMLRLRFDFSSDWAGWKAGVAFRTEAGDTTVPIVNGKCNVPDEIAAETMIKFAVVGRKDDRYVRTVDTVLKQRK